jgi:hypothetical protein
MAKRGFRGAAAPAYRSSIEVCPERCVVSGPNTGNRPVYTNFKRINKCPETKFYDFSLYNPINN